MSGEIADNVEFKHEREHEVVHPETGLTVKIKAIRYSMDGLDIGWIFDEPTRWPCPDAAIGRIFCNNCVHVEDFTEIDAERGVYPLPPGISFDENDAHTWYWGEDKEKHDTRILAYCNKGKIKLSYNNCACEEHNKFHDRTPQDELYEINKVRSNLTDIGNGERFATRHSHDVKYCHVWEKWLVWDGRRWELDPTAEVERRAKETVFSIYTEASNELLKKKDRENIIQHAQRSESNRALKAMLEMASSEHDIIIKHDQLDNDKYKINLLNYTLNLKTLKHYEHERNDYMTKMANVEYKIDAQCPKWLEFLNLIFDNDQETIKYVQKACGYSLSGDIGEQKLFILWGNGENGKSTFLDTIMAVLGDYAMSCPTETFMIKDFSGSGPNNDIARLKGARFVTAAEIEEGKKLAESLVKQATGGDKIAARFLHQEFFEFVPEFKLWFCTQHKPGVRGTDRGIWRRLKLIPFNIIVPNKLAEQGKTSVKNYHEVLIAEEAPGIFMWMLQGWILWNREGLKDSQTIREATSEYKAEMDALGKFIEDCCTIGPQAKILYKELYARYILWYRDNNFSDKFMMGDRKFATAMTERGFVKKAGAGNQKYFHGISIKEIVTELSNITHVGGFSNTREGQLEKPPASITLDNSVTISKEPKLEDFDKLLYEKIKESSQILYNGGEVPLNIIMQIMEYNGYDKKDTTIRIKKLLEIGELISTKEGYYQVT